MKKTIKIFGSYYNIQLFKKTAKEEAVGYTNYCFSDGKFVPVFDLDGFTFNKAVNKMSNVIDIWGVSHVYLFKTNNGYHAVSCSKVPKHVFMNMLDYVKGDVKHADVGNIDNKWVLRLSPKRGIPILLAGIIKSKNRRLENSFAHYNLLNRIFKIEKPLGKFDNSTEIERARYWT